MTHLQIEAPLTGAFNRTSLRTKKLSRARDEDVSNLIIRAFARYDIGNRYDVSNIVNHVTHIHQVEARHPFPARPSSKTAHVLVTGWGSRSQILRNGARQITDVIIPGDFCVIADLERETSSYVEACGPARIAALDTDAMSDRSRSLVEHARRAQQGEVLFRLRARLVSLGRRNARERLAYLVAETHARLGALGLTQDDTFDWPFTQEQLGDMLGLTPVHINRVLGRLRDEGLLVVRGRKMVILDLASLHRVGEF
ncbi:Crp/Fnr family transcriptional regulator [Sphingomonas sp. XXL09]|uniref:Crp/Fnr family transcriptional regulator n=1 Tax=Sphingomonas sp. XXL09 TaxID=3457787 RepID=UPI00406BC1F5